VFVQARAMMRASGPEPMKPIGETEFAPIFILRTNAIGLCH
jgi:hypothetical protein